MSTNIFGAYVSAHCRFDGIYDHCKIKGYKKEQCYRLIGFPPDFKFSKKKDAQIALAFNSETFVSIDLLHIAPTSVAFAFTQA